MESARGGVRLLAAEARREVTFMKACFTLCFNLLLVFICLVGCNREPEYRPVDPNRGWKMTRDSKFSECIYHPAKSRIYIFLKGERWVRSIAIGENHIELASADGVLRTADFLRANIIVDVESGERLSGSIPAIEMANALTRIQNLKMDSKYTLNDIFDELKPLLKNEAVSLGTK